MSRWFRAVFVILKTKNTHKWSFSFLCLSELRRDPPAFRRKSRGDPPPFVPPKSCWTPPVPPPLDLWIGGVRLDHIWQRVGGCWFIGERVGVPYFGALRMKILRREKECETIHFDHTCCYKSSKTPKNRLDFLFGPVKWTLSNDLGHFFFCWFLVILLLSWALKNVLFSKAKLYWIDEKVRGSSFFVRKPPIGRFRGDRRGQPL
jgi:hypothetical protein